MKKFLSQYRRRQSDPVRIGGRGNGKAVGAVIGGGYPVAVQTMTDTSTMDTGACVAQIERIREAGCRIVRLTAPGRREAENLGEIREELRRRGIDDMALVADIHFNPEAAMIAADHVDKVRINPGNFGPADGSQLEQLLEKCRAGSVALRIGVNHGSLARHIVEKWGDTPRGMVESAMEFLRECRRQDFNQVVVSMKSSNVRVMVHAYRLLAARMDAEGMRYPLHLGVTEAGDGADGRIKSAAGIGALLADGIGDTIRVSLTEPPENEIPVARQLVDYFANREPMAPLPLAEGAVETYDPYTYSRRKSDSVGNLGGENMPLLPSELDAAAREALVDGRIAVITATSPHPAIEWRAKVLGMIPARDSAQNISRNLARRTATASCRRFRNAANRRPRRRHTY